mgnify:FL=1
MEIEIEIEMAIDRDGDMEMDSITPRGPKGLARAPVRIFGDRPARSHVEMERWRWRWPRMEMERRSDGAMEIRRGSGDKFFDLFSTFKPRFDPLPV